MLLVLAVGPVRPHQCKSKGRKELAKLQYAVSQRPCSTRKETLDVQVYNLLARSKTLTAESVIELSKEPVSHCKTTNKKKEVSFKVDGLNKAPVTKSQDTFALQSTEIQNTQCKQEQTTDLLCW